MVEYLRVPSHTLVHGDGLDYDELALIEPLAIGAHGVRRAGVTAGEFVLVIGAGPIGLGTLEFARVAGGEVIVMDNNQRRLKFCEDELGIKHTLNPGVEDAVERVKTDNRQRHGKRGS